MVERCLWVTPSPLDPHLPPTSASRFAERIATHCEMVVVGLKVWSLPPTQPYDVATEVAAVGRAAADRGWPCYHLFGFSAGATVALATARANPQAVSTLALFEPATIGDDDWSPLSNGGGTIWHTSGVCRRSSGRRRSEAC